MALIKWFGLFSFLLFSMPQVSSAALIKIDDPSLPASGDGFNITRDTSTGVEWLDVDASAGRTYDDLTGVDGTNEFIAGGDFAGFRYATFSDYSSLLMSGGIGGISFFTIASYPYVRALIDYTGCSGNCANYGYSLGTILDNSQAVTEVIIEALVSQGYNFGRGNYGVSLTPDTLNTTGYPVVRGNWLVRSSVVPLPGAIWLFGFGLFALLGLAKKERGQIQFSVHQAKPARSAT